MMRYVWLCVAGRPSAVVSTPSGPGRRPARFRPAIESLENRLVPSTYTVTDLGDDGVGSGRQGDLRYCINAANADTKASDHIVFQPGLTGTITLVQGELDITKSLEIDGPGADLLTISGNQQSGVFALTNDSRLQDFRLAGVAVADGTGILDPFFGSFHAGGGLYDYSESATVTLTRCTFADNAVSGPVDFGGAVAMGNGTLVMDSCTLVDNKAGREDGAIALLSGTSHATLINCVISGNTALNNSAIGSLGTVTLDHCLVANNVGDEGGGYGGTTIGVSQALTMTDCRIEANRSFNPSVASGGRAVITRTTIADNYGGGGVANYGSMTISDSTISGNVDLHNYAGGVYDFNIDTGNDLQVDNTTISGNTSTAIGGIRLFSALQSVELASSTITNNSGLTGGLFVFRNINTGESARAVLRNTIIAGNQGGFPDVSGSVISFGYNLIGQTDGSSGWGTRDLTGTSRNPLDAQLSPLQDNGGPTLTHAPTITSPAHLHGDPSLYGSFDQRGTQRINQVVPPDIGALMFGQPTHLAVLAPDQVVAGEPFDVTIMALDSSGNRAYVYQDTVHFSSSDPSAGLPANYQFRPTDWGARSFTVTLNTAGSQSIQVVDMTLGFLSATATVEVQDATGTPAAARPARDWVFAEPDPRKKDWPSMLLC
jgi:hypothetical protein